MLRLNLNNNNKFNIINKLLIIYAKSINIQIRCNKHIQIYKSKSNLLSKFAKPFIKFNSSQPFRFFRSFWRFPIR